ncbi:MULTISPECIES: succinylglutamate desuccinylase/aspartoacylase family protein [Pimelobacter]|uniref:succinylglutamate desuccinylase/aspartoacylase family protein n=1 Tax=Pimelobacter TaxID=2044 RepID=UPI001C0575D7|nr:MULTISPECIES: succinylglutamate desuccinylase/aspartoacylase family protein [Pimelobacter]MBU2693705.1 succinylglutamate desuccinylase [Pimelobacter sp. 30-1]UUW90743.1 succinylglutamate desuccinylase/aspartoacylase family protein [Pimelobacter simplex]UUW94572.1 succinylglutamate desuccinylase/aspartoacylase family protein [Pimelobacter simplex]
MALRESFAIGNVRVRAGSTKEVELPITRLVTGGDVSLPVRVVHGREPGPTVWVNAAIHGDEVLGVEVIRQALATLAARTFRGTLVAVPVVNVLGFMTGERNLPDRRDLNRSFPGSARGSLASRIAHLFMTEVVAKSDVGIDLHTAADRRSNLPQIRADLDDPRTRQLAEAFGAPVMLHARLRDGSLRQAARDRGATVLLYEAGEALRFEEEPIAVGVAGVRRVLAALDMIDLSPGEEDGRTAPVESRSSAWVRARGTGILHLEVHLGERVEEGQRLGGLSDTFGRRVRLVHADRSGIIIGLTRAPIVNAGDALVHIASPVE